MDAHSDGAGPRSVTINVRDAWSSEEVTPPYEPGPSLCGAPETRLYADTPRIGALFGAAIAAEGSVLVATAPFEPLDVSENRVTRNADCTTNQRQLPSRGKGRVRVFERTPSGWSQQSLDISGSDEVEAQVPPKTFSGLPDGDVYPTYSVAISAGIVAVGIGGDSRRAEYQGSVRLFRKGTAGWREAALPIEELTSKERDLFGMSVALSGRTLVVGAPSEDRALDGGIFDGGAGDASDRVVDGGAAYVYQLDGTLVSRLTRLAPRIPIPSAYFGYGLAVNADWIAVGAPGDDPQEDHVFYGNVYMYRRNALGADYAGPLEVPERGVLGTFGSTLALRGDTLVAGAPTSLGCSLPPAAKTIGAALVFKLVGDKWVYQQCLDGRYSAPSSAFAHGVAIGANRFLVGAPREMDPAGRTSGTAYVYELFQGQFYGACIAHAREPVECGSFGLSLAVTDSYVAIGAPHEGGGAGAPAAPLDSGEIYIYPPQ